MDLQCGTSVLCVLQLSVMNQFVAHTTTWMGPTLTLTLTLNPTHVADLPL